MTVTNKEGSFDTPNLKGQDGIDREGTSDYNQLVNRPSINNIELMGNNTLEELGLDLTGYAKQSDVDAKYPKTGGVLNILTYIGMRLKRNTANGGAAIRFENSDGILGTIGFGSTKSFIITKDTGTDGHADLIEISNDGTSKFFNEVVVERSTGPTFFRFRRTDTGVGLRFGVAQSGIRAGLYSENLAKWILYCENNDIIFDGKAKSAEQLTDGTTTITVEDIANKSYVDNAIATAITNTLEGSY